MIRKKVQDALSSFFPDEKIHLLTPKNPDHGDYAFHVKSVGKDVSLDTLQNELFSNVKRIDDFINLTISPIVLMDELTTICEQKDMYGTSKQDKPKKINLEYGQPNTHKLPHIGHLFSYMYGESLARLLESSGNIVRRCNYQGDVGLHVAKCLYVVQKEKDAMKDLKTLEDKVQFLQKSYQEGSKLYKEHETSKNEINELNKQIYKQDAEIVDLWKETRAWSLEYYENFEKRLGISYDTYYFETESGPVGKKIVQEHVGSVFEESDGAIIFRGEPYGLHTRVFINQFGNPTYEAKDVGLIQLKKNDWPFDRAILTTASEQNAYYQVVKKAIELIFPDLENKILHIGFGMVDLKSGKMSSRTGNIVSAIDLVDEVEQRVRKLIDAKEKSTQEVEEISRIVSLAAVKYSFLKSEAKKNIAFDINESISTTGNSGPYLLYTYARCMSVLKKSGVISNPAKRDEKSHKSSEEIPRRIAPRDDMEGEELSLLRAFFRFPEVVADAAKNYAPHLIATYLFDLAQKFNSFYEKMPILKAEDEIKAFRLLLTTATAQLLKNGLHLLGISVLDHI